MADTNQVEYEGLYLVGDRSPFECAARKQSLPEPAECSWPVCGCDPYADKVISALEESDHFAAEPQSVTDAMIEAGARGITKTLSDYDSGRIYDAMNEGQKQEARDVAKACLTAALSVRCQAVNEQSSDRTDALYESAYIAGLNLGFSLGLENNHVKLNEFIAARDGYLAALTRPERASPSAPGASAPVQRPRE